MHPLTSLFAAAGQCGTNTTIIDSSCLPHAVANTNTVSTILNIVFGITASIALLMIVIAGFRYIVAHGDPHATATARNTILYAIIGLLVTMVAYVIVIFVVREVG